MHEHELWLTKLFNDYLAGLATSILNLFKLTAENPARPWQNWVVMELLVFALLIVLIAVVRTSFSVDKPGKLQHLFEVVCTFLKTTANEVGIQHEQRYINYLVVRVIFMALHVFVSLLQAYIFTLLTMIYVSGSTAHEH